MASRPLSSGIWMSIVTTSGWSAWTCSRASCPLLALPTTRNSPDPVTSSLTSRRKNGLSSTTRTPGSSEELDTMADRANLQFALCDVEPHRAAFVATHRFGHDGNGQLVQHFARRDHVAIAHLHRTGWHQVG